MASNDAAPNPGTDTHAAHSFGLAPATLWIMRFLIVFGTAGMAGFAAFCLYIYLVDDQSFHSTFDRNVVVIVFGGSTLAAAACLALQWPRVNRATIHANDEGIWQDGRAHEFVRWEQVRHVRERPLLQCMELLDENRQRLIRVENQIEEYAALQALILAKSQVLPRREAVSSSLDATRTYSLSLLAPVGYGAALLLVGYLFVESVQDGSVLWALIYGLCVLVIGVALAFIPLRLTLLPDRLEIRHLFHTKRIPRGKIVEIRIDSEMENFQRYPSVAVVVEGEAGPIELGRIGSGAIHLYSALLAWRDEP